ncbi:junctional adhesion molecule-like isoform X2 [Protopterus annectens]|uniref:junctional adhesion molecule-like isoform X2 n=1 Tax=Protopterus annectens TaxID=7888 RepID=UPI001CFB6770|nr:junctional adhesion molecule-like isoform X2 [Protopterus annectens]
MFYLSFIMFAVITDTVSSAVKVSVYPMEPNEGTSVLLECLFHGDPSRSRSGISIDWFFTSELSTKPVPVFLYYGNKSFPVNNRTRWVGDINQNNGSITLLDLQPSDSGNYTCVVQLNAQINNGQTGMKVIPHAKDPGVWTIMAIEVETETSTTSGATPSIGGNHWDWKYIVLMLGAALIGSVIGSVVVCLRMGRHSEKDNDALTRCGKDVEKELSGISRSSQENVYTAIHPDKRKNSNVEEDEMKKQQQENVYMNQDDSSTPCRNNKDLILEKQMMIKEGIKQQEDTYITMDNTSTICRDKKQPPVEAQMMKTKKNKDRNQHDDAYITMHPVREPTSKKPAMMDMHLYEKLDEYQVSQTGRKKNSELESMLSNGLLQENQ